MDTLISIAALLCGIIGLLGAVVPVLPGTIVSYLGMLLLLALPDADIATPTLVVWGVISVAVILLDYILPAILTTRFGGTKAGSLGATIGTIIGLFLGVPGIILGPFVGAVAGEMIKGDLPIERALGVGFGSMLSFLAGTVFKLVAGCVMLYYIIVNIL